MAIELKKQDIQFCSALWAGVTQTVVDTDIIVPDSKPDVVSVLQVDAIATVNEKYIQKDYLTVSGNINYTILYISDESSEDINVKSILYSTPYSQQLEIKDIDDSMIADVKSAVIHIDSKIQNSRKINVKAAMEIKSNVVVRYSAMAVCDIESDTAIPKKTHNVKTYNMILLNENELDIGDALSIPAGNPLIDEVLKVDVKIDNNDNKVVNGKVISKGNVNICTLYIGNNHEICSMEHEISFTEVFDIDGITTEMQSEMDYRINSVDYKVVSDKDGDLSILDFQMKIDAVTSAYEESCVEAVYDLYSPDYELEINSEDITVDELVSVGTTQCVIKDSIEIASDMPPMAKIFNIIGNPYVDKVTVSDSKINVEGVIEASVLYMSSSEDSPMCSHKKSIPFLHKVDIPTASIDIDPVVKVNIDHTNYSFNSGTDAEVRFVVSVDTKAIRKAKVNVITDVVLDEENAINKKGEPSIIVYFAQAGDSLWNIAKRYHTTVSDIASVNKIDDDAPLNPGRQLLIPKRKAV